MRLSPDDRLGPYEILAPLGAGGMGEVYKARDTRLDRTVAIKVIAEAAEDASGRGRFDVEARAIASLKHPNICALYDVGHQGDVRYLVMEYLEGETLAQRLRRGPLTAEQSVARALEIADALDAAHSHGITHRDLKPANVFLATTRATTKSSGTHSRSGEAVVAKLLDFGLAKLRPDASPLGELQQLATQTPHTAVGAIVGTLHYMAPEQVEGHAVDARTDIFAFGALFYEMLTGKRAFDGKSAPSVLGAILERQPPSVADLAPDVPPGIVYALERCLAKHPDERWQSARDLRAHLHHERTTSRTVSAAPRRASRLPWVLAALGVTAAIAFAALSWRAPASPEPTTWLSILPPPQGFGPTPTPAISPDGRAVAFVAPDASGQTMLWVRALDSPTSRVLPGTEGASEPFWSPDSRQIGVFSQGKLKTVDPAGGLPHVLADAANARGGSWSRQGEIVFVPAPSAGLFRVPATGGTPQAVATSTADGALLQGYPSFLPDGRHLLYFTLQKDSTRSGIYHLDLDTGTSRLVSPALSRAVAVGGRCYFTRDGSLFSQAFDAATGTLGGEPTRLADDVGRSGGASRFNYAFSVADDGTLAYWSGTSMPVTQPTWLDRSGRRVRTVSPPDIYHGLDLSQDGQQIALERADPRTTLTDIRIIDLAQPGGVPTPLVSSPEGQVVNMPLWSPDGSTLLYAMTAQNLFVRELRTGLTRQIDTTPGAKWPTSWAPNGQAVVMDQNSTVGELWVQPLTAGGKAFPYLKATYNAQGAQVSPDGRWLAYRADETGEFEIYVDAFPTPGRKVRVSANGGSRPRWRPDGGELFYMGRDRRLMAVAIDRTGDRVRVGAPQPLFELPIAPTMQVNRTQYAVTKDGQLFLVNAEAADASRQGIAIGRAVPGTSPR